MRHTKGCKDHKQSSVFDWLIKKNKIKLKLCLSKVSGDTLWCLAHACKAFKSSAAECVSDGNDNVSETSDSSL